MVSSIPRLTKHRIKVTSPTHLNIYSFPHKYKSIYMYSLYNIIIWNCSCLLHFHDKTIVDINTALIISHSIIIVYTFATQRKNNFMKYQNQKSIILDKFEDIE